MPVVRYQIRNEYGLADPGLYGAADKDDPEALLEGVAMAGLVGVLRQLGDLAEFAAEIFHDLHEEVMASAARGHSMMLRVQQLEAEFPAIERAFLSQTSHSHLVYNAGIDLHPNIQIDQNLITRGDMPRFILNSYEECRGPPQLFTLDKFDVAGAGACLKRYSDPSFFKMDFASSGVMEPEIQREKKARKAKRKGLRLRNGETTESPTLPDVNSKSQHMSSENVPNNVPMKRVRLKMRPVNSLSTGNGKSYMECILKRSSPDHEVSQSCMKTKPFDSHGLDPEVHEIAIDSSSKKSLFSAKTQTQSPDKQKVIEEDIDKSRKKEQGNITESSQVPINGSKKSHATFSNVDEESRGEDESRTNGKTVCYGADKLPEYNFHELEGKVSSADTESKTDGSGDMYVSDDVTSELDHYMDALTTMDSEIETDNESRAKPETGFLSVKSKVMDSDRNKECQEAQVQFSESQSTERETLTCNSLSKKEQSNLSVEEFSCNLSGAKLSQGNEAQGQVFETSETYSSALTETLGTLSGELQDMTSEAFHESIQVMKVDSSENLIHNVSSDAKEPEILSNGDFSPQGSLDKAQLCNADLDVKSSDHAGGTENIVENLDSYQQSALITSKFPSKEEGTVLIEPTDNSGVVVNAPTMQSDDMDFLNSKINNENDHIHEKELSAECVVNHTPEDPEKMPVDLPYQISEVAGNVQGPPPPLVEEPDRLMKHDSDYSMGAETVVPLYEDSECLRTKTVHENAGADTGSDLEIYGIQQFELQCLSNMEVCEVFHDAVLPKLQPPCPDEEDSTPGIPEVFSGAFDNEARIDPLPGKSHSNLPTVSMAPISPLDALLFEKSTPSYDLITANSNMQYDNNEDSSVSMTSRRASGNEFNLKEESFVHDSALDQRELEKSDISTPEDLLGFDIQHTPELLVSQEEENVVPLDSSDRLDSLIVKHVPQTETLDHAEISLSHSNGSQVGDLSSDGDSGSETKSPRTSLPVSSNSECISAISVTDLHDMETTETPNPDGLKGFPAPQPTDISDYQQENTKTSGQNNGVSDPSRLKSEVAVPGQVEVEETVTETEKILEGNIIHLPVPCSELLYSVSHMNQPEKDQKDMSADDFSDFKLSSVESDQGSDLKSFQQGTVKDDTSPINELFVTEALTLQSLDCVNSEHPVETRSLEYLNTTSNIMDYLDRQPIPEMQHDSLVTVNHSKISELDIPLDATICNQPEAGAFAQCETSSEMSSASVENSSVSPLNASSCDRLDAESCVPLQSSSVESEMEVSQLNASTCYQLDAEACVPLQSSFVENNSKLDTSVSNTPISNQMEAEPCTPRSNSEPLARSEENANELDVSSLHICDHLEAEAVVPSQSVSVVLPKSLENISDASFPTFPGSSMPIPETSPMKIYEACGNSQLVGNPVADCNASQGSIDEAPPLPPLPPLQWRVGKLQTGSPMAAGLADKPTAGANPFTVPFSDNSHGHPKSIEEKTHSMNPFAQVLTVEEERSMRDEKYLCGQEASREEILPPLNPFVPVPTSFDQSFQHFPSSFGGEEKHTLVSSEPHPILEPDKFQSSDPNIEEVLVQPSNPFLFPSTMVDERYQYSHRVSGAEGEQIQPLNLSIPPTEQDVMSQHIIFMPGAENLYGLYPVTGEMDAEKPNGKPRSILNRPRDPLIEAVAAHDKSTLRRVSEMDRPPAKPDVGERNTLLEQIRNKSFNLKPAVVTKPNINAPATNLKVAAILEKANAIRQAFVGSDEDEDDNWSDC